jgi:uncharacterized membrane protein YbhN (UPF0104 family)
VNLASITARLNAATAWAFAAGVVMLLVQMGLCAGRWRLLVEPASPRPGLIDTYRAFLEGQFFNQGFLSTVGGDAWRVVRWRAAGVSLQAAAASVFMDRLSGAMGAAILAIPASLLLSRHGVDARLSLFIFVLGVLVLGGGVTFIVMMRRRVLAFRRFERIQNAIATLQGSLVLDRRYLASLVYSVAGYCICGIVAYGVARSLDLEFRSSSWSASPHV